MSPARHHYTTQLRMFSYLATTSTCRDAAASIRACIHKSCKLLLTVLPELLFHSTAIVSYALLRVIETHHSAVASASAMTLASALIGPAEALSICTFAIPVTAAT
eukprot:6201560-Pleurochrysis_carterae.AAC.5